MKSVQGAPFRPLEVAPIRSARAWRRGGADGFRAVPAALLLLCVLAVAGCDQGSTTQPGPRPTPTPVPLQVEFASEYDGSPASVAVELAYSTPAQPGTFGLVLAVNAHELPNVDGVFFDLVYPPERIEYKGFYNGPQELIFATSVGLPNREQGRLRCFFSNNGFPRYPVNGSGKLMEIYFDPVGEGAGEIFFEGYGLVQAETQKLRYGKLDWFGASVTVSR